MLANQTLFWLMGKNEQSGDQPMSIRYIHGFSREEQQRLIDQAQILAPAVFEGLALPAQGEALEIGCGVGAELKLIAEHRPELSLTGLDINPHHLQAAAQHLEAEIRHGRVHLVQGDALGLPFPAGHFDLVLSIWVLEHIGLSPRVLAEWFRVLNTEGWLICTEVDNSTLRFDPPQPLIADWWERLNLCQRQGGGDPEVGTRLAAMAKAMGCDSWSVEPVHAISSRLRPARRALELDYLERLLLSANESLCRSGLVDPSLADGLKEAFAEVRRHPGIEFEYRAVRLSCRPPPRF